jgi:hypothetical protein
MLSQLYIEEENKRFEAAMGNKDVKCASNKFYVSTNRQLLTS